VTESQPHVYKCILGTSFLDSQRHSIKVHKDDSLLPIVDGLEARCVNIAYVRNSSKVEMGEFNEMSRICKEERLCRWLHYTACSSGVT
jgi:hypothetical protein